MYANRAEAGRELARSLKHLRGPDLVVLGLPRGGVPVAYEVARELDAPLDVIVVRKLGVPFQPELAMGAVGEEGILVLNRDVVRLAHVSEEEMASVERRELAVVAERAARFRAGRPRRSLDGKTALIVDDGVATGATARAACRVARALGAHRVVLGVPVGPPETEERFRDEVDELVCPDMPFGFYAVGQFYRDFSQTSDDEVTSLLTRRAAEVESVRVAEEPTAAIDEDVEIPLESATLHGRLTVPAGAQGVVLFAHGSGSSRHSPRNRYVAEVLQRAGIGTLLFDLLTTDEEHDRRMVFDVGLLADRLADVTAWVREQPAVGGLPIGYFGASTGAAAALGAAADPGQEIAAVVSRGGRPDLAIPRLPQVKAATLFVVGGRDTMVLDLNREAQRHLRCKNELAVVPGATHLFEEPGTLAQAAGRARDWFSEHLLPAAPG
ncbi:MAG TPA: phosphoribosyltransferase [Nocardioidaceae bacterium]|nr:phosphoribosyltransferase [Nocardioidaceae bacterium]